MFGRATITLGIGPHSSLVCISNVSAVHHVQDITTFTVHAYDLEESLSLDASLKIIGLVCFLIRVQIYRSGHVLYFPKYEIWKAFKQRK